MDKYNALWVSHSSIRDFLLCPQAYFLKNVYKDPKTGHKISLMTPSLALGQAVHHVLESLSRLQTGERFHQSLIERFHEEWKKVSGKSGGFFDEATESNFRRRGEEMLRQVYLHPGPLERLAVKINDDLPHFWLSEDEGIILCGKIDWLEYIPETDSVHIIDFKTGQKEEDADSLQLPIYLLIVHHCQKRNVVKVSYWYLERDGSCQEVPLPKLDDAKEKVLFIARKIKLVRQNREFHCPEPEGCRACLPYQAIVSGKAEYVGVGAYQHDVYVLKNEKAENPHPESVLL